MLLGGKNSSLTGEITGSVTLGSVVGTISVFTMAFCLKGKAMVMTPPVSLRDI